MTGFKRSLHKLCVSGIHDLDNRRAAVKISSTLVEEAIKEQAIKGNGSTSWCHRKDRPLSVKEYCLVLVENLIVDLIQVSNVEFYVSKLAIASEILMVWEAANSFLLMQVVCCSVRIFMLEWRSHPCHHVLLLSCRFTLYNNNFYHFYQLDQFIKLSSFYISN